MAVLSINKFFQISSEYFKFLEFLLNILINFTKNLEITKSSHHYRLAFATEYDRILSDFKNKTGLFLPLYL